MHHWLLCEWGYLSHRYSQKPGSNSQGNAFVFIELTIFIMSCNCLVTNVVPIRTFCLLKEKWFCIIYICEWSPCPWSPLYVNRFLYPHTQIYPIASGFWPEMFSIHGGCNGISNSMCHRFGIISILEFCNFQYRACNTCTHAFSDTKALHTGSRSCEHPRL